ncbi:hypothetical protein LZ198_05010 [Myxococcus sp. K15C18031901]|uniref:hypothetical protein n=1 Tax=Myxococcus dinghuensis TaxID=2906761 RepID=UPI0020A79530|nr:hypothetical protein [Myxococcus dinghuensis]MCP3098236.1 hypothetical protein [Myxococcus dinghuensis]
MSGSFWGGVLGWWVGWLVGVSPAGAASYEVEPEAAEELELVALLEDGAISAETLGALLTLRGAGVDLERATRASLHALPGLTYADVDARLRGREARGEAALLSEDERVRLAPFLVRGARDSVTGTARLVTDFALSDVLVPPVSLQARARGPLGLSVGVVVSRARRRLGEVRRDARLRSLVVDAPGAGWGVPKLHVRWEGAHASVLLGTYRLGFGQRLTLDTTALPAPEGFIPDDALRPPAALEQACLVAGTGCEAGAGAADVTPDHRWDEGFRGVAGTLRVPLGDGQVLALTGFGSYQSRGLVKSALRDLSTCGGPGGDCAAPEVLVPVGHGRAERLRARTLPGVFDEWAGGGHARWAFSSRAQVGVTGWTARPVWSVPGARLDFGPGARYPSGGGFGAVGADAAWGVGALDLFLEAARSFDVSAGGGGGWALFQRTVVSGREQEWELSLRYYSRGFANPYSGATSGPDLLDGMRVRNELGARVRSLHRVRGAWRLRGQVDAWTLPSDGAVAGTAGRAHVRGSARADWLAWEGFQPSLQVDARESGLRPGRACDTEAGDSVEEVSEACAGGSRYGAALRVRSVLSEQVVLAFGYGHSRGVEAGAASPRQDARAVAEVRLRPVEALRLSGRVAWKDEDLSERTRLRQEVRTTVDASWAMHDAVTLRGRYAWVVDLKDARGARVAPDAPRHLFRLEVETRL